MSLRVPARTQDLDIESCSASSAGAVEKYMPPDLALHHTQPQEFLRYMHVSDFESSLARTTYRDLRQKWSSCYRGIPLLRATQPEEPGRYRDEDYGDEHLCQQDEEPGARVVKIMGDSQPGERTNHADDDRDDAADRLHRRHKDAGDEPDDHAGDDRGEDPRGCHGPSQPSAMIRTQGDTP
jgi:hypothetical protein